jgi:nitrite reductase/ring-hydroxylating ferredoxin subunit
VLRCAWHGWEFDIPTGEALVDPKIKAKKYRVTVENGDDVVLHV